MKYIITFLLLIISLGAVAQAHLDMTEATIRASHPNNEFKRTNYEHGYIISTQFSKGSFDYYFDEKTNLTYLCVQIPLNVIKMNGQIEQYNKEYVITSPTSWTAYFDNGTFMYIKLIYNDAGHYSYFTYSDEK